MVNLIQTNAAPVVGFLTLLSNIVFVVVLIVIAAHSGTRAKMYAFVHKYILQLLFWGIMAAVVGSLVYSNIVGFPPCDLCWYQRLFLYPQAIIVLMAMFRKNKTIIDYLVPLSILGGVVALYQSIIQWGFSFGSILNCTAIGGECAKVYVREYSYITIPFMSLSVFVYIIALKLVYYHHNRKINRNTENVGK